MNRPCRAVAVAVVLALSGCAIGPDYERPQLPVPVEFRGVLSPQEATSFADQHWAEVFNDPELAYALGASSFLSKPVKREDIIKALRLENIL